MCGKSGNDFLLKLPRAGKRENNKQRGSFDFKFLPKKASVGPLLKDFESLSANRHHVHVFIELFGCSCST